MDLEIIISAVVRLECGGQLPEASRLRDECLSHEVQRYIHNNGTQGGKSSLSHGVETNS